MDRERVNLRLQPEELRRLKASARACLWSFKQAAAFAIEHALDAGEDLEQRQGRSSRRLENVALPEMVARMAEEEAATRGWELGATLSAALVAGLPRVELIADTISDALLEARSSRG